MKSPDEMKNDSFSVRTARLEDAPAIATVQVKSWQRIYRGIMSDSHLDGLEPARREAVWHRVLSEGNQQLHVCTNPSGILGFSNAGGSRDSPSDAEVYAIYVHPDHWGKGCGRALFLESCAAMRSREFENLSLWVATQNDRARAFYERAGMVPDGATKSEFIGGAHVEETRYRMSLRGLKDGQ
jgi:ribosomal protein S18 acetylase RimI-like enzyme